MVRLLIVVVMCGVFTGCSSSTQTVARIAARQDRSDTAALIQLVSESDEPWVCADAASLLGTWREKKAVPVLISVLENPYALSECKMAAGFALGQIGDPAAVIPLVNSVEKASGSDEKYWLVAALCSFNNNETARNMLESLVNDPDVLIARAAQKGLVGKEK